MEMTKMADYIDVFARVPFGYNGKNRDRGEVFKLIGGRNDDKLIGMRYVLPFSPKEHRRILCDRGCGREFIAMSFYDMHKKKKDCNADQGTLTRGEVAELIGADPDKMIVEVDREDQRAMDLSESV
jgi:hypothetical protein